MVKQTRQIIAFDLSDPSRDSAKQWRANLLEVYRKQAVFYTDQYEAYKGVIPAEQHKVLTKKPVRLITLTASLTPHDSASLGWYVPRLPSPKSWPVISAPPTISSASTTLPGPQHYLHNTTVSPPL